MQSKRLVAIVVSISALAAGVVRYFQSPQVAEEPFDAVRWQRLRDQSQLNDPGCVRGGMALALARTDAMSRRTRAEVIALLGAPDEGATETLRYGLGQCHGDWRHSVLVVRRTPGGDVSRATVEVD